MTAKLTKLLLSASLFALAGTAATTYTAEAGTLDDILARGELRVAVQTQGPPYSFMDKAGARTGSAIQLTELMAKEMGVKVTYLDFDWDGLIPALMSGKADILAADMTATLTRATKVAFTKPWIHVGAVAFTTSGSDFKSVEDCKKPGTTIAVILGSTAEKSVPKFFPEGEMKSFKGGGTVVLDAVASGQAQCGVNDNTAVAAQVLNYPENTFTVFPDMLTAEPLAYAVRYDSQDLLTWTNLFLDTVQQDGRLKENLDYWVNSNKWQNDH
ncbi:ABC transporter substrate-binding protein [Tianweitania populi]|uniref:Amino acid ABC transporter substrate-binding protein n=1 Tax=Tianweitania populi TaxID=1607949 RepID=A0A8J3DTB7_9HYPH|nr:ABC transporter substrate-binding protein [Tianweitania populi]GHD23069.1 amino acid ABC transporter substrate-binding protein [Tianweitania populi]